MFIVNRKPNNTSKSATPVPTENGENKNVIPPFKIRNPKMQVGKS